MPRRIDGRDPNAARAFIHDEVMPRGREIPVVIGTPEPGPVQEYRKTATILARQINDEVTVVTPEGAMDAHPGDYIASDNPPSHLWPIRREVFEKTYVPVRDPDDTEVK